ncbi:hypothetical protein L218DRAFT_390064 [Marasmius fiardii PR-910]|nr:hypothetical protein L218DRAFT_390064 [Marasmius fiardii PR-910]
MTVTGWYTKFSHAWLTIIMTVGPLSVANSGKDFQDLVVRGDTSNNTRRCTSALPVVPVKVVADCWMTAIGRERQPMEFGENYRVISSYSRLC